MEISLYGIPLSLLSDKGYVKNPSVRNDRLEKLHDAAVVVSKELVLGITDR